MGSDSNPFVSWSLARRMILGRDTVAYPCSGDLNVAQVVVGGRPLPGYRWREREFRHHRADRESGGGALVDGVGGYDRDPLACSGRGLSRRQVDEHLDRGGVAPEVRLVADQFDVDPCLGTLIRDDDRLGPRGLVDVADDRGREPIADRCGDIVQRGPRSPVLERRPHGFDGCVVGPGAERGLQGRRGCLSARHARDRRRGGRRRAGASGRPDADGDKTEGDQQLTHAERLPPRAGGNLCACDRRTATRHLRTDNRLGASQLSPARLQMWRYDLKLWITHSFGDATYLPR